MGIALRSAASAINIGQARTAALTRDRNAWEKPLITGLSSTANAFKRRPEGTAVKCDSAIMIAVNMELAFQMGNAHVKRATTGPIAA